MDEKIMSKKFDTISELKEFIDSERESNILEWKDYNAIELKDKRDAIIKALCGFANNKGGFFVIGVNNDGDIRYTDIDFENFTEVLDNWLNTLIEPKGLRYKPYLVIDDNGQCIIVSVESTPSTCYAQRTKNNTYRFPYRTYGSTRYYPFEEFFKIYIYKFLRDTAISAEFIKREEEKRPSTISAVGLETPLNSELVDKYVDMLVTENFSSKTANMVLEKIRNEVYKVFSEQEVNEADIPTIKKLVEQAHDFIKDKDEDILKKILDIVYLLTRAPEALKLVREFWYDYLKELYETGKRYDDLVKILDACGYFGDRITEIKRAIDNRDQKILDMLISRLDFSEIREKKFEIITALWLKIDTLDHEKDKSLIERIISLIRRLASER